MTRLFDLAAEYRQAADKLVDLELPDEVVRDTLESISGPLEAKAGGIAAMVADMEVLADNIRQAERRMAERRRALEARAERVRDFLLNAMLYAGVTRIESPFVSLAVRTNPPAVEINEPGLIPAEFMRQPEPPPPVVDKVAIKAALSSGQDVPGAHLVQRKRLEVR